ncbi:MAG TPA: hypothetical protein VG497_19690 [Kribbella sp.]|nr:hypothetical protein [Kribbella sp.]
MPVLAAVVATAFAPEVAPAIVVALVVFVPALRVELRMTENELVLRRPVDTVRIPRADVELARFDWVPFGGTYLEIHRRSGRVDRMPMAPRWTSTELSGDPPAPDSAAYIITRWAEDGRPTEV